MTFPPRFLPRIVLGLGVTLALSLPAATPEVAFCFAGFGAVSDPEEAKALSIKTYESLLDLAKDGEARRAMLTKLIAAADPFAVEGLEYGLEPVAKRLTEFHEMLKKLNWLTPELRESFLAAARAKVGGIDTAVQQIEKSVESSPGARDFPLENGDFVKVTREGRYYLSLSNGPSGDAVITVHDTVSNTEQSITLEKSKGAHRNSYALNADNTKLVMAANDRMGTGGMIEAVRVYDFKDGKVNPQGTQFEFLPRDPATPNEERGLQRISPLQNPNWLIAEVHTGGVSHFQLVDLAEGKTFPIAKPATPPSWTAMAGTNSFASIPVTKRAEDRKLVITTVGAGGQITTNGFPLPAGLQTPDIDGAQGDLVAVRDFLTRQILLYGKSGLVRTFNVPEPKPGKVVINALLHPNGKELGITTGDNGNLQLYWFDLAKETHVGTFPLPVSSFELTPDGESLIIKESDHIKVEPILKLIPDAVRP